MQKDKPEYDEMEEEDISQSQTPRLSGEKLLGLSSVLEGKVRLLSSLVVI
eukprot:gene10476-7281_t